MIQIFRVGQTNEKQQQIAPSGMNGQMREPISE